MDIVENVACVLIRKAQGQECKEKKLSETKTQKTGIKKGLTPLCDHQKATPPGD